MADIHEAKSVKGKLKILFKWIVENDNSYQEKVGDARKMTPKELVHIYGPVVLKAIRKPAPSTGKGGQ